MFLLVSFLIFSYIWELYTFVQHAVCAAVFREYSGNSAV